MTESDQTAFLTPDDISALRSEKLGFGCLIILIVFLFIGGVILFLRFPLFLLSLLYVILSILLIGVYLLLKWSNNSDIEKDITGGKKRVIIAPIENKRIVSSEIRRGSRRGEITSKYYIKVKGREYPMSESAYLTIKAEEFVEIQEGPVSKQVIIQKWLKKDGTSELVPDK